MDKRRQSILKQDGRIPLQETVLPDFPEEDTATVTVTKSRRVSFGANFVKEFLVGSAVSAQIFSEYEQAVSSSDSSNQNTSRSEIMDQSTFQCEGDALNLCVKQIIEDELSPVKKKFCSQKLSSCTELSDRNNENIWDFNVSNASNIFTEKNAGCSNKHELSKNNIKCSKKAGPLIDSSMVDKQLHNRKNESGLNSSKMDETIEKKSKIGKFSSTIFFSADSPTADVEFTEGCISLAKSIFDKKKKEMTVYIKGTPKVSKKEDGRDGSNTVVFESDDSDVGMKLTRCVDESEAESDMPTVNFSKYFPSSKDVADASDDFDESHENIENVPLHMYSLNAVLGRGDLSQVDAEMERSLFFPERSLTEMLHSDRSKTAASDVSSSEQDNTDECDMEISSPNASTGAILDEGMSDGKEETRVSLANVNASASISCHSADEEEDDCTSPVFSKASVGDDVSLTSEDSTESELATADPPKMLDCEDITPNGDSAVDLSNCCPLKITASALSCVKARDEVVTAARDRTSEDASSSSVEDRKLGAWKEESEEGRFLDDNREKSRAVTSFLEENKKSGAITSPSLTEILRCSLSCNDSEEMLNVDGVKNLARTERSPCEGRDSDSEIPTGAGEKGSADFEETLLAANGINREVDVPISATKEVSPNVSVAESGQEVGTTLNIRPSSHVCESEVNVSKSCALGEATEAEPEAADATAEESPFREDNEHSPVFGSPKSAMLERIPSSEDKKEGDTENYVMPPEGGSDGEDHEMEVSAHELNLVKDESSTNVKTATDELEELEITYVAGRKERISLQETRFDESSFLSRTFCEEGDRTSLGDKKILGLLTDQSEESNCCWRIDSIDNAGDINSWSFSIPILKNSAIMKFKLRPPKDKSLFSFSFVLDCSLELRGSNEYQLEKDRIGVEYAFGKLKTYFHRESRGLDNVHNMPLFLDKINLIVKKMNGILRQVIRILKEYPGSLLKESILSFRIYSFPLLFSYGIEIDVSDPFQLSENSVAAKKHFGDFNTTRVKSVFRECLGKEEPLTRFIAKLTELVMGMEREIGFVTKRSHIRLISRRRHSHLCHI